MKICFMGDGNSIHIKRWMDYFNGRGHEVHLITFSEVDNDKFKNMHVHKIGDFSINAKGGNWQYLTSVSSIKKAIKEIKPDIISSHYITSYGFLGSLSKFKPYVITAWGTDILVAPKKNFIFKALTKYALKNSQLVTVECESINKEVKAVYNSDTIIVPMGIENKICELNREKEKSEEIKIISLRTVNENSNIDLIVKAFKNICLKYPNKELKLVIANDGVKMQEIKEMVKKFNLEDKVEIKGFISREVLVNLLLSSDIHISIPSSDATSVTLLEAMVCGIMNIVSNIPANREWIKDKENGLIVEKKDEEHMTEALDYAINKREKRKGWEDINRKLIKEKAVWENNMAYVEENFEKLIKLYSN